MKNVYVKDDLKEFELFLKKKFYYLFEDHGFEIVYREIDLSRIRCIGLESVGEKIRINVVYGFRIEEIVIGNLESKFEMTDDFAEKKDWKYLRFMVHDIYKEKGLPLEKVFGEGPFTEVYIRLEKVCREVFKRVREEI